MSWDVKWEIAVIVALVWFCIFLTFGALGFVITFHKGRKGAYREKLWDARREIEDAANTDEPLGGYQPKSNSLNPRSPGDE